MNSKGISRAAAALLLVLLGAVACGQYTVTILNPSGASLSIAMAAQGGHQVGFAGGGLAEHAVLWTGTSGSAVDLNPSGWARSRAYGVYGALQVGTGAGLATGHAFHALTWTGTAGSYLDIHPIGFTSSMAFAAGSNGQVGEGMASDATFHALLWYGTAGSAVDLHPTGCTESAAYSVSAGQQVGYGVFGGNSHALLWTGTAGSVVDLNPIGMTASVANATDGVYQVGVAAGSSTGGASHAMLWQGTPVATDLNPPGFTETWGEGLANDKQVGFGYGTATGGRYHALVWTGAPIPSVIDLHNALGGTYTASYAYAIDPTTGQIVGEAITATGRHVAVMWSPANQQIVYPDAFSVYRGRLLSGGLSELLNSDDLTLAVMAGAPVMVSDSPIMVDITGTSPVHNPSVFKILLEARAQFANISQTIELYDYVANSFVQVDTRAATTTDSVIEILATNPQRFVQTSTNQIRARLRWRDVGPVVMPGWRINIDQAVWKITP